MFIKFLLEEMKKRKSFLFGNGFGKNRQLLQNADIIHCHDVFYWYLPFRFLYPHKPVFTPFTDMKFSN